MILHPPTLQDPSSDDIDSMVASLYRLLASSANVLGACTPPSALGAGWIQSTTEVAVLSAVSGAGTTQPVTSCDSEWGAAVAAQVREGGVQQLLKGEKCMASLWEAGCGTTAGSMAKQVRSGCIDSLRVAAVEWTHPVPQCSDWNNVELEHVQLTYSYTMSCLPRRQCLPVLLYHAGRHLPPPSILSPCLPHHRLAEAQLSPASRGGPSSPRLSAPL